MPATSAWLPDRRRPLDHEGDEEAAGKARGCGRQGKPSSLLGADRAREQARMLVDQAIGHLAQHGKEADLLRELARFIVERSH
jgi:farnesyl diphosphate synthase